MPQPDLVIFDCDGVLVDSEIIAARVDAELLTLAGYEISAEEISESYAGLTFKDIMLRVEEKSRIPFQASLIDREEQLVDRKLRTDVRAIDGADVGAQFAVDQLFLPVDQRGLEGDAGLFLDPQHDVLEGQAGIALRNLLSRYLVSCQGQKLGVDTGGDDLGIDEHAVAIEDDKVWLGHGDPDNGRAKWPRKAQAARHTPTGPPSQIRPTRPLAFTEYLR